MKKFLNIIIIVSFSMAGCYSSGRVSQSDNYDYSDNYNSDNYNNTDITYQTFYDQLQPYGNWINYPEYGNVWQPYTTGGFRPYETGGHWVSTVDGWAWASDYNWGWAPFHYGRWFYDQRIGWAWVPGYEWAPAWVTWGQYNNYYAWAPLAPGINISFGNTWRAPSNYWCFVPRNYINYSNIDRYTTRNSYNTNVNNITIINNYNTYNQRDYYDRGPDYKQVQRFTDKPVTPVRIATTSKPGSSRVINQQFEVFRPTLSTRANNANSATRRITPPNRSRTYKGDIMEEGNTGKSVVERYNNRISRSPKLNNGTSAGKDALSNGVNNGNNKVTREDIENTNRRLQQQQMDRFKNPQNPVRVRPQNNQPNGQTGNERPEAIRRYSPVESSQPARPQPGFRDRRIMQSPAFPQQNERIMRQSPTAPAMPNRVERGSNPVRNMQMERPVNPVRRPQQ